MGNTEDALKILSIRNKCRLCITGRFARLSGHDYSSTHGCFSLMSDNPSKKDLERVKVFFGELGEKYNNLELSSKIVKILESEFVFRNVEKQT